MEVSCESEADRHNRSGHHQRSCQDASCLPGGDPAGTSGIAPLDLFDVSQFSTQIGCQVKAYNPTDYFTRRQATHLSRTDQLALIAAREAVA